jgi:hypothetical protein
MSSRGRTEKRRSWTASRGGCEEIVILKVEGKVLQGVEEGEH